jgi:hypothetical protein
MGVTAATIGAVGAVGAAGISAGTASKGGGGGPSTVPGSQPYLWESLLARQMEDMASEERRLVEASISEGRQMAPEMYRALGWEPTMVENPAAAQQQGAVDRINAAQQKLDAANARAAELRNTFDSLGAAKKSVRKRARADAIAAEQEALAAVSELSQARLAAGDLGITSNNTRDLEARLQEVTGKLNRAIASKDARGGRGQNIVDRLRSQQKAIMREISSTSKAGGTLKIEPYTITGFTRIDPNSLDPANPFSAKNPDNILLAQTQARLQSALSGGVPTDPTLLRALDDKERVLREELRRNLGADYENTTLGRDALNNWARERSEAVSTYNTNIINDAQTQELQRRGQREDLVSSYLDKLSYVPRFTQEQAAGLGRAVGTADVVAQNAQRLRAQAMPSVVGGGGGGGGGASPYADLIGRAGAGISSATLALLERKQQTKDPAGQSPQDAAYNEMMKKYL